MSVASLLAIGVLLVSTGSLAWGNFDTHNEMTGRILAEAAEDPLLESMLRGELALPEGDGQRLVLQLGLDADVDADLRPYAPLPSVGSRLTSSWLGFDGFKPAPDEIRLVPNADHCSVALDRAACVAQLATTDQGASTVARLIQLGVWAEDNPNPRSRHHFHDTEKAREGGRGLDNSEILLFPGIESFTEWFTAWFRGGDASEYLKFLADRSASIVTGGQVDLPGDFGNFDYEGRSALERALGSPEVSAERPVNRFSLSDAEEFLFQGLTAEYPDQREGFFALHFLAVGHALHMIEDLSSPPHVRNDFVVEHGLGAVTGEGIENKGEAGLPLARRVLEATAVPAFDATGFDVSDFFSRDAMPGPHDGAGSRGLAEYVHDRFLSEGSLEQEDPYLWFQGYAKPALPSCSDLNDSAGSGQDLVQVRDLTDRDLETGETVPDSTQRYLTHRAGKRLAACRMYSLAVAGVLPIPTGVSPTTWNDGVRRDYYEHLWPLAVAYGREFLRFYYQPRLRVLPTSPRTFKLANPTMLELEIPAGGVLLVYGTRDAATGLERRVTVPLECGGIGTIVLAAATAPNMLGPEWPEECTLPSGLAAAPPTDPTQFWIVARGRHGERGRADGSGDRVVAFDRVTAEIFYAGLRERDNYGTDAELHTDIFQLSPSLADPSASTARNLTLETRRVMQSRLGLTDAEREELDFAVPTVDAQGKNLAFGIFTDSVATVPPGETLDPSDPDHRREFQKRIAVAPIDGFSSDPEAFRELDLGGLSIENGDLGIPSFDGTPGSRLLVYQAHDAPAGQVSTKLVVYQDPETDGQVRLPALDDFWLTSAFRDLLATSVPAGASLRAVGFVDRRSGAVVGGVDETQVCFGCSVALSGETHAVPMFSPDGRYVTYERLRDEPPSGVARRTVMVADVTTGAVHELQDESFNPIRGQEPSFSPDGRWILYLDTEGQFRLFPFTGAGISGTPVQITAEAQLKGWGRWRPGLTLPRQ